MKKSLYKFIVVSLVAVLIVIFDAAYFTFIDSPNSSNNKVIIIDPGHGGIDGGAIGKGGTVEKDINLAISQKVKGYIESGGDTCIMIREVDEGLYIQGTKNRKNQDLKNRKQIIRENKADVFISIHLNSFPQSQYYGAQVFYPSGDVDSQHLAKLVQEELIKVLNRGNKRVEKPSDNYYLLKDNGIPSIIVECGFLSNPEEERLLKDEEYQNKISWAIYCGLNRFFSEPKAK